MSEMLESSVEQGELAALAEMVADAPCQLGRLGRTEVEILAGTELLPALPKTERGRAFLQWLDLLYVLKRWRRERPETEEPTYRRAAQKAFLETTVPTERLGGHGPAGRLAQRLRERSAQFRELNPGLSEACYWLACEALARWAEAGFADVRLPPSLEASDLREVA